MSTPQQGMDMGFTQEIIPECHHVCLIYDNEEQRRKIVAEYLAAGVRQGNIVRYFADLTPPDEVRAWLTEMGIEVQKAEQDGPFAITAAEKAYCPDGQLVPGDVVARAVARYDAAMAVGYNASRVCGEMTWVLRDIPNASRFLEYEARLNLLDDHPFPHIGMCQYDAHLFDGATLFKVLQVHPFMIAQGQIVRNPFYIKPDEFLAQLQVNG